MNEWREQLRRAVKHRAAADHTKEAAIAHRAGIAPVTLSRNPHRPPHTTEFRDDRTDRARRWGTRRVDRILGEAGFALSARERNVLIYAAELILHVTFSKADAAALLRMLTKLTNP